MMQSHDSWKLRRVGHKKAENIETLFQLYDMLEASCQETLKGGSTTASKDAATATQLLDELRIRFVRLVGRRPEAMAPTAKFSLVAFIVLLLMPLCHWVSG
jgi:GTP cyclohydrolase II